MCNLFTVLQTISLHRTVMSITAVRESWSDMESRT